MARLVHRILILAGFALAFTAGRATAQDNFDANKSPAQLFANDCSGCHKSAVGLVKSPGLFGLESYLREHYTASRQAAAAIAGYLRAVDAEQAAAPAKRKGEPRRKAEKPVKKDENKSSESKAESKTEKKSEPKSEAKSEKSEPKPEAKSETKPAEPKAEVKSETKSEAKPAESQPAEAPKSDPPKSDPPKSEEKKSE
jgi:outer membrane biosynthesis protein TonB